MARLHSDLGQRTVYLPNGTAKAQGLPCVVYKDAAGTQLANLAAYDQATPNDPAAAIVGAGLTVDAYSLRPAFWDLDDLPLLYISVDQGPVLPLYPDAQPLIAAAMEAIVGESTARGQAISASVTAEAQARAAAISTAVNAEASARAAAVSAAQAAAAAPLEVAARNLTGLGLQAKGGSMGTGGKPVVSIRFDHHLAPLRDTIWPLMVARGLPASVGIVSRWPTGDTFSAGVSWADLRAMVRQGLEVWCHSATHGDATTQAALVDEIVTSRAEIEAQGFKVQGWQVPGLTATYADWNLASNGDLAGPVGRLVSQYYPFSEGYAPGSAVRPLPHRTYHGLNHTTIEALTLLQVQNAVLQAMAYGAGIQLMLHPGYIGQAGYMSLATLTSVLDWLVARRDAGEVEVLTATGLIAADPGHSRKLTLIGNPSFDPDFSQLWTGWNISAGVSLRTTGGHTGANFVEFTTAGTNRLQQASSAPLNTGTQGGTFRVEAWMRATTAAATGVMRLVDNSDASRYDETRSFNITTLNTWQRVWWNTTLHPSTLTVRLELFRDPNVAQPIQMDDITITPV